MENFYVGQDIVAIVNHDDGHYKEGEIYKVRGLRESTCLCLSIEIDIGLKTTWDNGIYCSTCNKQDYSVKRGDIFFQDSRDFRPLDSLVNISELTEILTEPIEV